MRPRKAPSEQKAERELKEIQEGIAKKRADRERQIISNTFSTEDGRHCLSILMKRCKYQSPVSYIADDGIIHTENLQHNAALQGLYLWLRKHVDKQTLTAVEVEGLPDLTMEETKNG